MVKILETVEVRECQLFICVNGSVRQSDARQQTAAPCPGDYSGAIMNIQDYCNQSDAAILRDIVAEHLPILVVIDKEGWRRICQVRGRNFSDVNAETWKRICEKRGEAGPPAGPYS